jgi:hypothetical protein
MLIWDKPQTIEGVTVYSDDPTVGMFYIFPQTPRFRIDPQTGKPIFKFLKYRNPIDRTAGKKGGGFLIFDVEFTVSDEIKKKVTDKLQEQLNQQFANQDPKPQAKVGQISYTRGTTSIQFLDSGGALVEKIQNPGSPSLYGTMVTPITIELSPEGATLAEQALQGSGGVVQVVYDLWTPVKLPPVKVDVWFDARKFMEFHQEVHIDWNFWGEDSYRETIREKFVSTDSGGVTIDPGTVTDQKVLGAVRDWGFRTLDEAVKRIILGDIPSVSAEDRKVPDGIESVYRDITVDKVADYRRTYTEGQVMEWNPGPRGTLPNITSLKGADGQALKWADFAQTVDLDDPFFKQLNVNVHANADFTNLPIHSIEVHVDYREGNKVYTDECRLSSPDEVGKFATFIENNNWKYRYDYTVNYKGASQVYRSQPMETDDKILTINVADTGILQVDAVVGDINFEQVSAAQVTMQYEDSANGVTLLEEQFTLDKDKKTHQFQKVIFQPRRNPYQYKVKYFMKDGKEFSVDWIKANSPNLAINDPFSATKTIGVRSMGDLQSEISTIFVDLKYWDAENQYTQSKSIALSRTTPFSDWTFPVISETKGKVTYSGNIQFADGRMEEIKETETTKSTILVGKAKDPNEFLEVQIDPDLIDFAIVKLVKVSLHYVDLNLRKDYILKKDTTSVPPWSIRLQDKTKRTYNWNATFFMTDGTSRPLGTPEQPKTTSEPTLLLEVPNA